jgi:hypothetical protein
MHKYWKNLSECCIRIGTVNVSRWRIQMNKENLRFNSIQVVDPGTSVADPGCLSRILILTHPGSRIQKQLQKRGVKNLVVKHFCSHIFYFWIAQEKIWAKFQRIMEIFNQKVVTKFSKIWIWDPRSRINLFRIPDPGVKKATDPGSATQGHE